MPPRNLLKHLQRSLSIFSGNEMEGIECIWLLDEACGEHADRIMAEGTRVYGAYHSKGEYRPCEIVLFVRDIYCGVMPFFYLTSVPVLQITQTLAHEVAHHLVATRGYIFELGEDTSDQESLAERYARSILDKMRKSWRYKIAQWMLKQLADIHYSSGVVHSSKQRYCEAAKCWYEAWHLNPKLENVDEWYWLAKEECEKQGNSGDASQQQVQPGAPPGSFNPSRIPRSG